VVSAAWSSLASSQTGSSETGSETGPDSSSGQDSQGHQADAGPLDQARKLEKKVYLVAREIMSSEKVYVVVLNLIVTDFNNFYCEKEQEQGSEIMPPEDFASLFGNLKSLLMFNTGLLEEFEDRVENWVTNKKIADVIVKRGPFLKLYTEYIKNFSSMNSHFDDCYEKYPDFEKTVKEFEGLPQCGNLKIKHNLLKPVQRLPQYRLLLEDYLKHLSETSPDFDDTTAALNIVTEAAEHANDTVRKGDKLQRLLQLQARVGDYELVRPGRELVKEGELGKISRKEVVPRYFILLSDCLLYTTYQGPFVGESTGLRVSYTIPLSKVRVSVPTQEAYQTEFSITSNVRSVTLRAKTVAERNEWLEAINTAIEEYSQKKASFVSTAQLDPVTRLSGSLGDSAPVWIPDERVTMCQTCSTEFSIVTRRHHCRACGKVVCSSCSANRAPLKYRQWEVVRVCDHCFQLLSEKYESDSDLGPLFKRRDISRTVGRYIPQRLKVGANAEGSQMSGYLRRRQPRSGKWKRWWFVLKDKVLYTYKASEDTVAVETMPVLGWTLETLADKNFALYEGMSPGLVFQLEHPGSETIVFSAEDDNFAEKWGNALREATTLGEESNA